VLYNVKVSEVAGRKPEKEHGAAKYVVPCECCAEWTRSAGTIHFVEMRGSGLVLHQAKHSLNFCPWCGVARHNDKNDQAQRPGDTMIPPTKEIPEPGSLKREAEIDPCVSAGGVTCHPVSREESRGGFVWRCRRCGKIIEMESPNDQAAGHQNSMSTPNPSDKPKTLPGVGL